MPRAGARRRPVPGHGRRGSPIHRGRVLHTHDTRGFIIEQATTGRFLLAVVADLITACREREREHGQAYRPIVVVDFFHHQRASSGVACGARRCNIPQAADHWPACQSAAAGGAHQRDERTGHRRRGTHTAREGAGFFFYFDERAHWHPFTVWRGAAVQHSAARTLSRYCGFFARRRVKWTGDTLRRRGVVVALEIRAGSASGGAAMGRVRRRHIHPPPWLPPSGSRAHPRPLAARTRGERESRGEREPGTGDDAATQARERAEVAHITRTHTHTSKRARGRESGCTR